MCCLTPGKNVLQSWITGAAQLACLLCSIPPGAVSRDWEDCHTRPWWWSSTLLYPTHVGHVIDLLTTASHVFCLPCCWLAALILKLSSSIFATSEITRSFLVPIQGQTFLLAQQLPDVSVGIFPGQRPLHRPTCILCGLGPEHFGLMDRTSPLARKRTSPSTVCSPAWLIQRGALG